MTEYPQGRYIVEYGTTTIEFELVHSNRETLAIHVYPDASVVIDAPLESPLDAVLDRVQKKAKWITKQQRLYRDHQPTITRIPSYESGETHYYLGKQYRLKVVQDDVERVRFYRGRLYIHVGHPQDRAHKQELLQKWYRVRAKSIFFQQLDKCYPLVEPFGIPYPDLKIREMKSRWGSASPQSNITLNLKLIYVPKRLINYVVLHELCHLREMNHSATYYALLAQVLPNWEYLREELNSLEYV
jgi:predicted metal-dependent hydrolase